MLSFILRSINRLLTDKLLKVAALLSTKFLATTFRHTGKLTYGNESPDRFFFVQIPLQLTTLRSHLGK
jgi:hypothetical protein